MNFGNTITVTVVLAVVTLFESSVEKLGVSQLKPKCLSMEMHKVFEKHLDQTDLVSVEKYKYINETNHKVMDHQQFFFAFNSRFLTKTTKVAAIKVVRLENVTSIALEEDYEVVKTESNKKLPKQLRVRADFYRFLLVNPHVICVMIAYDPLVLYHYLKTTTSEIRCKDGGLTVILFSSERVKLEEIHKLLVIYWKHFGVLNVVGHIPFSCEYQSTFFIYKPFVQTKLGFGRVEVHTLENILKNPHTLMVLPNRLHGFPLKVAIFETEPTAIAQIPKLLADSKIYQEFSNSTSFYGADGITIGYISKIMNFTINLCKDPECQYFGLRLPNGTVAGSLGQVVLRNIDIHANSRFITDYETDDFEFSVNYHFDRVCVILPKAGKVPGWLKIISLFQGETLFWYFVLLTFTVAINKLSHSVTSFTNVDSSIQIYKILLSQPAIISRSRDAGVATRTILGSMLLFSVIMATIFIAALSTAFQLNLRFKDIETLQQVDEFGYILKSSFDPFRGSSLELYKRLSKKLILNIKNSSGMEFAASGKGAGVERELIAQFLIGSRYLARDGSSLLHIVSECPSSMHLGYIVPTGSPYLKAINFYLSQFKESGLVDKWYYDFEDALLLGNRMHVQNSKSYRKILSMDDVQGAFWELLLGLSVSSVVFLVELFKGISRNHRSIKK